jgi:tetrahydrodipicolinate N-succinyltransferase
VRIGFELDVDVVWTNRRTNEREGMHAHRAEHRTNEVRVHLAKKKETKIKTEGAAAEAGSAVRARTAEKSDSSATEKT